MRVILPVLAWLTHASFGCGLRAVCGKAQELDSLKTFAALLRQFNPSSGWQVCGTAHARCFLTKVGSSSWLGIKKNGARPCCIVRSSAPVLSDSEFDSVVANTVFMFPGQGAQVLGMGAEVAKEVPAAAELYKKAGDILGYDLLSVDDKEKLDTAAISQPAIFVASMAAVERLRASEGGAEIVDSANVACGLSLGECTALVFADAMSFEDGVRITKARGEAMQAAMDASPSGMVSVIGLNEEKVCELCAAAFEATGKPIQIARYLSCTGNYVCCGAIETVDKVVEIAQPEFQARMVEKFDVAAAFHTDFMEAAVLPFKEVLETVEMKRPRIPVISNVDAKAHSDPAVIKDMLAKQISMPVQWETIMSNLVQAGFQRGYELGPGTMLADMIKSMWSEAPAITNVGA